MKKLKRMQGLTIFAGMVLFGSYASPEAGPSDARGPRMPLPDSEKFYLMLPPVPIEAEIVQEVFGGYPAVNPEEVMQFIREQLPEQMYAFRKMSLRQKQRNEAAAYLSALVRESLDLIAMKQRDPQRFEKVMAEKHLCMEAERLAELARHADKEARETHLAKLRQVLESAFDARQDLMRWELQRLEQELGRLRQMLEQRERHRSEIIENRLKELTGDTDLVKW
ncbi:MAG: D52 family tumor protein [Kiritimatiellae bacterium]|nr:D52 family tumor protein [Kiritimatiellia bacterium]